ncbi:ABC transporter substrate-binding protein [Mesorhizobium sp. INR15]|uniref:urea ABC transporter substrate-binding protein n=1 Tax=Mesorhizobium sp. INR15 TaxID=2654248 RepID=UPI0027E4FAE9|nr:ABC transporter substrate-binding protein [Mesorhizobium sp. INR15]
MINRRQFLATTAATAGALALPSIRAAQASEPIKLGSILDVSGIFDAYGKPMDMAATLAVEELNAGGGLLGRQIQKVSYDTQSDMALYTQFAQQLVRSDQVHVVHGGILSASREAIRPTLRKAKIPYFYNVLYEGGVCDRNIVCTGITPAQQIEVLVPAAIEKFGKKVYVLAADYNYGQITAKWMSHYVSQSGGSVLATEFFPLDVSDFGATIAKIQEAKPDLVLSALVGGAHLSFYRQWAAAGMKDRIPLASSTLGSGNEHLVLTPQEGNGIMVAYSWSPSIDAPAAKAFLDKWKARFGDVATINEFAVNNYQGIHLWAEAVKKANTVDHDPVIEALESGLAIDGPSGKVTIDPQTHHAVLDMQLMEIRDQSLAVIKSFSQRQPIDTQKFCDLKANPDDNKQYEIDI